MNAWLLEDMIGAASQHVYGRKGDRVEIIRGHNEDMQLVEFNKERFHVKNEKLSDKPVKADMLQTAEEIKPIAKSKYKRVIPQQLF